MTAGNLWYSDLINGYTSENEVRQRRQTKILIILGWSAIVLPQIVQSFTVPKRRASVETAAAGLSHLAGLTRTTITLTLICFAAWLILSSVKSMLRLRMLPMCALLAPWAYIVIRDWYVTGPPTREAMLVPLVLLAMWVLRPRLAWLSTLGYLTAIAALISIAMAVIDPSIAIYHSAQDDVVSVDKQILPGGLLIGFLTQPNSLAKFIALGLPAVFLIRRISVRIIALGSCTYAFLWTASRTSMYAAVTTCAMLGIFAVIKRKRNRQIVGGLAVLTSMAVVCLVPFSTSDPTAFTNRGLIWQASLPYWRANPWFGQGAYFYSEIGKTSASIAGAAFHAHNQFVQFLVTGGICYALIAGIMLGVVALLALRQLGMDSVFGVIFLVTLAGVFAMEIPFPTVDNSTMIPVVLMPLGAIAFSRDADHGAIVPKSCGSPPFRDRVGALEV
jgi:O-antigen ligase